MDEKVLQSVCRQDVNLLGEPLDPFDADLIFIFENDSLQKAECYQRREIIKHYNNSNVTLYPRQEDSFEESERRRSTKLFKMPISGIWVQNGNLIESSPDMFYYLSEPQDKSIGSQFGFSRIHGEIYPVYSLKVVNQKNKLPELLRGLSTIKTKEYSNGVYTGPYKNDKRHGYGVYYFTNGDVYHGDFRDGTISNYGIMKYRDGGIYKGYWKNGIQHGFGKVVRSDRIVQGKWENGKINGLGKIVFLETKDTYVGEFKDDKRHGNGQYTWSNGDVYIGNWDKGKMSGFGLKVSKNSEVYAGMWKDDKADGLGAKYFVTKDTYIGGHKDDYRHGKGFYVFNTDDQVDLAEWDNGSEQGSVSSMASGVMKIGQKYHNNWIPGFKTITLGEEIY